MLHEGETTDSQELPFSHLEQQQQQQQHQQQQQQQQQGSRFIYHPLDDSNSRDDSNGRDDDYEWRMTNSREGMTERDTMMMVQYRDMEKEKEDMMSKMGEGESDSKTWAEEMALFSSKNDELLASCEEAILDEVQLGWST